MHEVIHWSRYRQYPRRLDGFKKCYLNSLRKSKACSMNMVLIDTKMVDVHVEGLTPEQGTNAEMVDATEGVIPKEWINRSRSRSYDHRVKLPSNPNWRVRTLPDKPKGSHENSSEGEWAKHEGKQKLEDFLLKNLDIFAWKHRDMVGINPKVSYHHLNVDPIFISHRLKRRALNRERYEALKEEVWKLMSNGFIKEAVYPRWISNPILVKKYNGKWRVCTDFSKFSQSCPKDSFLFSRINQLVDATVWHELLSFMDAYLGYNQIFMHPSEGALLLWS